jgi:hypothetical protein
MARQVSVGGLRNGIERFAKCRANAVSPPQRLRPMSPANGFTPPALLLSDA